MRMTWWLMAALLVSPAAASADTRPTVAVLYFDYSGKDEQLGVLRKGLAQMLISDLSSVEAVKIVERDRLEDLLSEHKLGQSGKIDPATAARIGKLLGARYLVRGGYFDLLGALRVDARVVEVETGRVVRSTGANGKPGEFLGVEAKLSEELAKTLGALAPAPAAPPSPKPRVSPPAQLKTKTALLYSSALVSLDKGDKAAAKTQLQAVVKEQPDFKLASLDLDRLMK
jgi:TolB-like protein